MEIKLNHESNCIASLPWPTLEINPNGAKTAINATCELYKNQSARTLDCQSAGEHRNTSTIAIAFFLVDRKLNEVKRIQRLEQPVAKFLHNVLCLQLGEQREHDGAQLAPNAAMAILPDITC